MITVGANFKTELNRETGSDPVILIHMAFDTPRRFAMWPYDVLFSGDTFDGLGPIQNIDPIQWENTTPLTEMFLVLFMQNDPNLLADFQQESRHKLCSIRLVFVDSANAAIDNESIFLINRRMIPGQLRGSTGEYTSQLGLESRLHRHRNAAPSTYSHSEQLRIDPTDFSLRDVGKDLDISRPKYVQKSGLG